MAVESQVGSDKSKKLKVRFYQGGTVVWVGIKKGMAVKKGQVLAKLDDKLAKIELDINLASYRRARAEFEQVPRKIFSIFKCPLQKSNH